MIKAGSRVKFISDTGTGVVRSIKGNIAHVEVDGFEIPAMLSDIVEVTREDENAAIVKIGPSDPKPGRDAKPAAGGKERSADKRTPGKTVEHYGRISLTEEYEDEPVIIRRSWQSVEPVKDVHEKTAEPVIEKAPFEVTDYEVKLAFVPSNNGKADSSDLDAYIINDSSYDLYYNISSWKSGYVQTIKSGLARADSKELVKKYLRSELSEIMTLHISLLPFKATSFVPRGAEDFDLELHPLKFVRQGAFAENDYFDEPALLFTLASSSIDPVRVQPAAVSSGRDNKSLKDFVKDKPSRPAADTANKPGVEIIDLHVENILENTEGMQPGEILKAQIARFTVALDGAVKSGKPSKMVFIHGVGKGKLKYEMKKVLDRQYSKLRYQDASFAEYGYGAIMVFVGK